MRIGAVAKTLAVLGAVVLFAAVYWLGAERHLYVVNVDATRHDQSAYLDYAQQMAESNYEVVGGRNRMPVYPFILSLGYSDELTADEWFKRAKYVNLVVSLVALVAVWATAQLALRQLDAALLTLVAAFTLYVYKAAYTQCELLYYTLLFLLFTSMLRLLRRPSWLVAVLAGVLAGIAYLTKAAVPPLIVLFALWGGLAAAVAWATAGGDVRGAAQRIGAVAVVLGIFLVTVLPYISTSRQRFGEWFYNVNSTFYIWYDSWDEAVAGTGAHGDMEHWPDLPPEQLPSAARYFREHTAAQVFEREVAGLKQLHRNLDAPITYGSYTLSFGAGRYLRLYAAICLVAILLRPRLAWRIATGDRRWIAAGFVASYVIASIVLYAFYVPIAPGPRHALALFLPVLFCVFLFLAHPAWREEPLATLAGRALTPRALHAFGVACLAYDLLFVYPNLILIGYAGR